MKHIGAQKALVGHMNMIHARDEKKNCVFVDVTRDTFDDLISKQSKLDFSGKYLLTGEFQDL